MTAATEGLEPFRIKINELDNQITLLLAQRFQVCADVAIYKSAHGIPMMQPDRVEAVKKRCAEMGVANGLRARFVSDLYGRIIQEACDLEDEIIDGKVTGE